MNCLENKHLNWLNHDHDHDLYLPVSSVQSGVTAGVKSWGALKKILVEKETTPPQHPPPAPPAFSHLHF